MTILGLDDQGLILKAFGFFFEKTVDMNRMWVVPIAA